MRTYTITTWAAAILGGPARAVLHLWRWGDGWAWELRTYRAERLRGREPSADDARIVAWKHARRRKIGIGRILEIEAPPAEVAAA